MKKLLKLHEVDNVLPADEPVGDWDILKKEKPDIICIGHDQRAMQTSLSQWIKKQDESYNPIIEVLSPYQRHRYSSSLVEKQKNRMFQFLLIVAMLLWGFSWISGKWAAQSAPPFYLLFWRFLLCSLIFLPPTIIENRKQKTERKSKIPWTLFSAIMLVGYNFLFFRGLSSSMAGKSGVIVTTLLPIFTLLLGMIFLKKRLNLNETVGFLLGITGGTLLIEPWGFSSLEFLESTNLLYVGAAFLWACLTLFSKLAQQNGGIFRFNFLLYSFSTLTALLFCIREGINPLDGIYLNLPLWLNIVYLALFASSIASGIYFRASLELGPAKASSFSFVVPTSAMLFSALFQQEYPNRTTILGAIISTLALILINRPSGQRKQNES